MSPKAKSTNVTTHRIELQSYEREALDMISASYTAEKVSKSLQNVLNGMGTISSAFTQATPAGVIFSTAVFGAVTGYIYREEIENEFEDMTVTIGRGVQRLTGGRFGDFAWRMFGPNSGWAQFKNAVDSSIKEL